MFFKAAHDHISCRDACAWSGKLTIFGSLISRQSQNDSCDCRCTHLHLPFDANAAVSAGRNGRLAGRHSQDARLACKHAQQTELSIT